MGSERTSQCQSLTVPCEGADACSLKLHPEPQASSAMMRALPRVLRTELPVCSFVTRTSVPNGRVLWAAVSAWELLAIGGALAVEAGAIPRGRTTLERLGVCCGDAPQRAPKDNASDGQKAGRFGHA